MKILKNSAAGMGRILTEDEINSFLGEKMNLRIATIDEKGDPNIQPVWFYHDKANEKIFFASHTSSVKIKNMRKKPTVYFIIDEEMPPNRCVKGKATASISDDIPKNLETVEKICLKYIGTLDHPDSKMFIDTTKSGGGLVVELTPEFYSTWEMPGDTSEKKC